MKIKLTAPVVPLRSHRHAAVGLVDRPGTGVDHGPSGLVEPETKLWVAFVHVIGVGVTPVQLDVVNVPRRKRFRVLLKWRISLIK